MERKNGRYILALRFLALALTLVVGTSSGQAPSSSAPSPHTPAEISELQKEAETGDAAAEFAIGQAYDFGSGVGQSDKDACSWYRKAAEKGYAPAQNSLGLMYRAGRGVEQSKQEAVNWYRKAARQDNAKAMFNLGTAYFNGDGVAIDDVLAYAWFVVARERGSEPAREAVNRTASSLLPWQVSSAYEVVGDMYEQGKELLQDHKIAIDWYRKAAAQGEGPVRVKLAKYLLDQGDAQNYPEVLHLCEEAGKQGYSPGALCAGLLYQRGIGTAPDLHQAARWITKSAELGNAKAMVQLGKMYWTGSGVKQDKISAYAFMLLASTAELPDAQHDKATYEQDLDEKQRDKARKQAENWIKQHPPLRIDKSSITNQSP